MLEEYPTNVADWSPGIKDDNSVISKNPDEVTDGGKFQEYIISGIVAQNIPGTSGSNAWIAARRIAHNIAGSVAGSADASGSFAGKAAGNVAGGSVESVASSVSASTTNEDATQNFHTNWLLCDGGHSILNLDKELIEEKHPGFQIHEENKKALFDGRNELLEFEKNDPTSEPKVEQRCAIASLEEFQPEIVQENITHTAENLPISTSNKIGEDKLIVMKDIGINSEQISSVQTPETLVVTEALPITESKEPHCTIPENTARIGMIGTKRPNESFCDAAIDNSTSTSSTLLQTAIAHTYSDDPFKVSGVQSSTLSPPFKKIKVQDLHNTSIIHMDATAVPTRSTDNEMTRKKNRAGEDTTEDERNDSFEVQLLPEADVELNLQGTAALSSDIESRTTRTSETLIASGAMMSSEVTCSANISSTSTEQKSSTKLIPEGTKESEAMGDEADPVEYELIRVRGKRTVRRPKVTRDAIPSVEQSTSPPASKNVKQDLQEKQHVQEKQDVPKKQNLQMKEDSQEKQDHK